MVFKQSKMLSRLHRNSKNGNEAKPLIKNKEQTDGKQVHESMAGSDQCPEQILLNAEVSNQRLGSILREILNEHSNPEEIDQFVESIFPPLPEEGPRESQLEHLQEFLKSVRSKCNEVRRLIPVLEDARLLDQLIASSSRHLFTKLDLLLNRDLSAKEIFCLLLWGKDVFFGAEPVFRVHDPLLLTEWFERATWKLLPKLQNDIARTLQNILCYDEQHGHEDSMDEEAFISVHIDVTQCLKGVIKRSKEFSQTLMHRVQHLCLHELHHFVQKYVEAEKKHLKEQPLNSNSARLFQVISTCRQLRFFAPQLNTSDNDSDGLSNINYMLKNMEDQVLAVVQKMMKDLAQDRLRCYFKHGDRHFQDLTDEIRNHCSSLPKNYVGKEIQQIFMNLAYDCVSRAYLNCLLKSKLKHLEERWGNVGERMKDDARSFHVTFTELKANDDQQNQLLQEMSEVLCSSDVDALKLTCSHLFSVFPNDSEQFVLGLLRLNRALSKRQLREVLDAIWEYRPDPKPRSVTCHPLKGLYCCLSCE